jgi:ribosomal protein L16 Arg81 hydroxylase
VQFRQVVGLRTEAELQPGDVLYLPALWFHNVTSIGFSVALNVFWRSHHDHQPKGRKHHERPKPREQPDPNLYSAKDLYGNRDPPAATRAAELAAAAAVELRRLPEPFRSFYARRAVRALEAACGVDEPPPAEGRETPGE